MISIKDFGDAGKAGRTVLYRVRPYFPHDFTVRVGVAFALLLTLIASPSFGREKKDGIHYGMGLIVNVPLPESEVAQVVEDVAQNTIIRGTKEYNKDQYVVGAVAATTTTVFPAWKQGGKTFYKVRNHVIDPVNFKNTNDIGTLAVRYVVQPQGENNTVLRIDAIFVEEVRNSVHESNGSVETSEYKDIQERLGAVELMKKETAEALEAKQQRAAGERFSTSKQTVTLGTPPATAQPPGDESAESASAGSQPSAAGEVTASSSAVAYQPSAYERQPGQSLEQHVAELKRQVERLVKKPGAPLQSAPFHTAATLKSLDPGVEVLILISTPYWYGVETRDGQHGWIRRDQLELAP